MTKGVLVVDDAAFMRVIIKAALSRNKIEVCGEAEKGISAIEKYIKLKPDLVILDINMPEMSGVEVLKEIQKIDKNAKIIICSALGHTERVVEAINLGAKHFIVKPFQEEELIKIINKIV